jgi:diadenosine tetraphosphatase ApaH/serine/threonine PP2A family protein phosphatase
MPPMGLVYDVHGNLPALEAVLDDAFELGVEHFLLGGDYALFGAWPAETVERLNALEAAWIRGNGERWTAAPEEAPDNEVVPGAIAACREALGSEVVQELAALPFSAPIDGGRAVHASPVSDVRSFFPEPAEDEDELVAGVEPGTLLVFGHTHLPFDRVGAHGVRLVNPGSVGMPLDGDVRASWAVLQEDGSVELRRVAYDVEASAAAVVERFSGAWTEVVARRIREAAM